MVHLERFAEVPLLTKAGIRGYWRELRAEGVRHWGVVTNYSGGSTGEPVPLLQDATCRRWSTAAFRYYYERVHGVEEPYVKKVLLWGSERDTLQLRESMRARVANRLTRTVLLNSFRMTRADMEHYVQTINEFQPVFIRGYTSSLEELARHVLSSGELNHHPEFVISSAEPLTPQLRLLLGNAFGCPVYSFYGSRECSSIAGECQHGLHHVFSYNHWVEVVDDAGRPVGDGEEGRVLVTTLHNRVMPLILFDIGDRAVKGSSACECGWDTPTLRAVNGRTSDHFLLRDGTLIYGEFFTHLLHGHPRLEAFRFVQEDYDKIRVEVIPGDALSLDERSRVEWQVKQVMGEAMTVSWVECDSRPLTAQGKRLYTISLPRRDRLDR
jgi:phenylacetate-CoA ligase